jgi:hypothetical protein
VADSRKEANVPLLHFVGWFVLMGLAPLGWNLVARRRQRGGGKKALSSLTAIVPLGIAAVGLAVILNAMLEAALRGDRFTDYCRSTATARTAGANT